MHTSTLRFLYFVLYHGRVINHSRVKKCYLIFLEGSECGGRKGGEDERERVGLYLVLCRDCF